MFLETDTIYVYVIKLFSSSFIIKVDEVDFREYWAEKVTEEKSVYVGITY